jgi:hypothetical protein
MGTYSPRAFASAHAPKAPCSRASVSLKSRTQHDKDALVSKLACLVVSGLFLTAPLDVSGAQQKEDAESFGDLVGGLAGANWNLFLHGGSTSNGLILLQRTGLAGERALRTENSWNLGAGIGVDLLKSTGLRASYTYSSGDLSWITDLGTGSEALNVPKVSTLTTHVADLELINYMTPARAAIAPYAAVGLTGSWFTVDSSSTAVLRSGGSPQFRWGGVASFGMQFHVSDGLFTQLEASSHSLGNPFAGEHSFTAPGGTTIDEPRRLNKTDFRIVFVYRFGNGK